MRLSFRVKTSLTIIIVSMTITIILSMIFYMQSVGTVQENYSTSQVSQLNANAELFDDTMLDAYYACVYAVNDAELKDSLRAGDMERLAELLDKYRGTDKSIDSVNCYLPNEGRMLKVGTSGTVWLNCTDEIVSALEALLPQDGENKLSPKYAKDVTTIPQDNLFSYSRLVTEEDGTELAQITVSVNERTIFFNCLQNQTDSADGECFILKDNTVVSGSDIYSLNEEMTMPDSGMLVTDVAMPTTDYHIVSVAEVSQITEPLKSIRNRLILIAILLNAGSSVLVFFLVRLMMRPMEELRRSMERVSDGDLKTRAPVYYEDEIGQLSSGFNNMLEQIEGLIEALVTEKMLKKEAEIEALQYQITPHFMYNTLNSIKYEAILQGSQNTADLLGAFIELLQMSASDRGAFITVEQEMHMVQNYVKLQQFRYADCFSVEFDVWASAEKCYVPRLLVQPLVENAILHGIDHRRQGNRISISAMCDEDALAIKVVDHGEGMTPEEIQNLLEGNRKSKFSGIGVNNIRERLRLYYGKKAELRFYSEKGEGTTAMILLPISYDAEEYTI